MAGRTAVRVSAGGQGAHPPVGVNVRLGGAILEQGLVSRHIDCGRSAASDAHLARPFNKTTEGSHGTCVELIPTSALTDATKLEWGDQVLRKLGADDWRGFAALISPASPGLPTTRAASCRYALTRRSTDLMAPESRLSPAAGTFHTGRIVIMASAVEHWSEGVRVVRCDLESRGLKNRIAVSKFAGLPLFACAQADGAHLALLDLEKLTDEDFERICKDYRELRNRLDGPARRKNGHRRSRGRPAT